ncbi:MAG: helix-turn-helix transcriptional regulator [Clostridia bacterium]|nr:helix-turn-helix transcriptional regulator [Clostridia bacterium]
MGTVLSADLLRGYTEDIILGRLEQGDSYGYQINKDVKSIASACGQDFEMKEATMYLAFRRLEEQGCITSYWGSEGSGARRRYYSITSVGQGRLQEARVTWDKTRQLLEQLLGSKNTAESGEERES